MSRNMHNCRFQSALESMHECAESLDNTSPGHELEGLSPDEQRAAHGMFKMCAYLGKRFGGLAPSGDVPCRSVNGVEAAPKSLEASTFPPGWKPIASIPKTLTRYLVAAAYDGTLHFVEGMHAFNEKSPLGTHFYAMWLDHEAPTKHQCAQASHLARRESANLNGAV